MVSIVGIDQQRRRRLLRLRPSRPPRHDRSGMARGGCLSSGPRTSQASGLSALRETPVLKGAVMTTQADTHTSGAGHAVDTALSTALIIVSSDTHFGPRLQDMREYCPAKYLADYDDFMNHAPQLDYMNLPNETEGRRRRQELNLHTAGHHDMGVRLKDMDDDGVAAEVIFHGSTNDQPFPLGLGRSASARGRCCTLSLLPSATWATCSPTLFSTRSPTCSKAGTDQGPTPLELIPGPPWRDGEIATSRSVTAAVRDLRLSRRPLRPGWPRRAAPASPCGNGSPTRDTRPRQPEASSLP